MNKKEKLEGAIKKRDLEKNKLFEFMIFDESQRKIKKQFLKYEKAHKEALEVYQNVS